MKIKDKYDLVHSIKKNRHQKPKLVYSDLLPFHFPKQGKRPLRKKTSDAKFIVYSPDDDNSSSDDDYGNQDEVDYDDDDDDDEEVPGNPIMLYVIVFIELS